MELFLQKVQTKLEYNFINQNLLYQAFIRKSYYEENKETLTQMSLSHNEILEYLGDAFLNCVIANELVKKNSQMKKGLICDKTEGELSSLRADLIKKETLSNAIEKLGFEKYLLLSEGDKKLFVQNEQSVKEDLFEAIIGAVGLDCRGNLETITRIVMKMLDFHISDDECEDVFSQKLISYAQKNKTLPPEYKYFKIQEGFRCVITFDVVNSSGLVKCQMCEGKGNTNLKAKKEASFNAWSVIDKQVSKSVFPTFDLENAINVLQELNQKKIIEEIKYDFSQDKGDWICKCSVSSNEALGRGVTKKDSKKSASFEMLNILKQK